MSTRSRTAKVARKGRSKALARVQRARAGRAPIPEPLVILTVAARWQTQMKRLEDWRARVEAAPSMQGEVWKRGQLRHIDALIATHLQGKPDSM